VAVLILHRERRHQTIPFFKEQPTDRKNHLGTPTDS
jgi:hypothetical protein